MVPEIFKWPVLGASPVYARKCEEATEVETHHQQTAATTMGVAEDETPSSLTSSHPNTNNPNQEDYNFRVKHITICVKLH
ncbi:hypothetical protein X777_16700 [Ooceraea biroi]|uniref:Uncharacterized protein n=1 Tax=Ooceraea biroi TaxID=2015173 RepID=A0A026VTC7_OOCBI|nr:hypothetical protein X777_16700 [Ooceraea biroi]